MTRQKIVGVVDIVLECEGGDTTVVSAVVSCASSAQTS